MTEAVQHRGPDGEGFAGLTEPGAEMSTWQHGETEPAALRLALGHRRLAIVDLSEAGKQPMSSPAGNCWIVFNGEVYNYPELRSDLERKGVRFSSSTDTEVILAAWEAWGPDCLARFNGMFAFLLFDQKRRCLHAVRDRFGIKPLYYRFAPDASSIAFASEIKQFEALPGWQATLEPNTAYDFLAWGMLDHTEKTLFQGVSQVPPGARLEIAMDSFTFGEITRPEPLRWYSPEPSEEASELTLEEAAPRLREFLRDSVRLRLRADVPVGSCLSGGLDSSSIVCLIDERLRTQDNPPPQNTFSARAEDPELDETPWMEEVLKGRNLNPAFVMPKFEDLETSFSDLVRSHDEPFGSASIFIQNLVFGLAREAGVKVVLDGQGADEILAGYMTYRSCRVAGMLKRGQLLSASRELSAIRRQDGSCRSTLLEALDYLVPDCARFPLRALAGKNSMKPSWLDMEKLGTKPRNVPREQGVRTTSVNALSRAQLTNTFIPRLLHWEDRNSMARSVEGRVPFLDHRVVEFCLGLVASLKTSQGVTKCVLREAMRGIIPDKVRERRDKIGFAASEREWFVRKRPDWFLAGIDKACELGNGLFSPVLRGETERMIARRSTFDVRLWRALCFGEWLNRFSVSLP